MSQNLRQKLGDKAFIFSKYLKQSAYLNRLPFDADFKVLYNPIFPEDLVLCKRLIAAYRKSMADFKLEEMGAHWSYNIRSYYGALISAIEEGNEEKLALELCAMFQKDFLAGITWGQAYKKQRSYLLQRFFKELVFLAEYLQAVPVDCTDTVESAEALHQGYESLIKKIEAKLGISITFPYIGSPYGIKNNEGVVMLESPDYIYVSKRITEIISQLKTSVSIVEIGAGFGGTAYWLLRLAESSIREYAIIDLPIVNVLQGYFLAKAFGAERINLYGEHNKEALINIMPTYAIESCKNVDVLINENSMPEMSRRSAEGYIKWACTNLKDSGIFYSYNQENKHPYFDNSGNQLCVYEIVQATGKNLKRISRNYSWVRHGWVEEIYKRQS